MFVNIILSGSYLTSSCFAHANKHVKQTFPYLLCYLHTKESVYIGRYATINIHLNGRDTEAWTSSYNHAAINIVQLYTQ